MFNRLRELITGGTFVQGSQNVVQNIYNADRNRAWDKLIAQACPDAIHDSDALVRQGICLEKTRETILRLLNHYLSPNLPSPPLLWLNGPAGAGKSAIARTIAQSTNQAQTPLISFFFYNSEATRNTIHPLIPTLAVQVCQRFRRARPYVEQAIEEDPLLFTKPASAQAKALIVQPLKLALGEASLVKSNSLAILIDGLDECNDTERQIEVIDTLLEIVAGICGCTPLQVKVLLSSRPERWIRNRISRCEQDGKALLVTLAGDSSSRADIQVYYNTYFARIREEHPSGPTLDPDWPSPEQMAMLVDLTGDHFAFAYTVRTFVADTNEDPAEQLEIVLKIIPATLASPHTHLDQLFNAIFSRIPKHKLPQTLRVIGAFLVPAEYALHPSPRLLELVFALKRGEIRRMFFHLESLFDLGDHPSSWIHVHHKTLADFLFDESRSKQYGLFIDKRTIYEDVRASVCSVFFRETRPDSDALVEFQTYLRRYGPAVDTELRSRFMAMARPLAPTRQSEWALWAVQLYYFLPRETQRTILLGLLPPSLKSVASKLLKTGPRNIDQALSIYDSSALGRLCLLCAKLMTDQIQGSAMGCTFHGAFLRHAIEHQPGLLELDKTLGLNLFACDPDTLINFSLHFLSQSVGYKLALLQLTLYDALNPDWALSRVGMLLPWHRSGHRSTDDPWECAPTGVLAGELPTDCVHCLAVIETCKIELIVNLALRKIYPSANVYQRLFQHIRPHPFLWNHPQLIMCWAQLIRNNEIAFTLMGLGDISADILAQDMVLMDRMLCEELDLGICSLGDSDILDTSRTMFVQPYSRACIPLARSDDHAIHVAKWRSAWMRGKEVPEVAYTRPDTL